MQKPCPSSVFQNQVKQLLEHDQAKAVSFLNSILNQLNWAFSEFIGMLQEIQQIAGRYVLFCSQPSPPRWAADGLLCPAFRPERNYVDSRQLKIAATCFDLTVGLLRVLEMIVHLCPHLFLNWDSNSSAEALLRRCVFFRLRPFRFSDGYGGFLAQTTRSDRPLNCGLEQTRIET